MYLFNLNGHISSILLNLSRFSVHCNHTRDDITGFEKDLSTRHRHFFIVLLKFWFLQFFVFHQTILKKLT